MSSGLRSRLSQIEGYGTTFTAPTDASGYASLHDLPEPTRTQALVAFGGAMSVCWLVDMGFQLGALVVSIPTKMYSLDRKPGAGDEETGRGVQMEVLDPVDLVERVREDEPPDTAERVDEEKTVFPDPPGRP